MVSAKAIRPAACPSMPINMTVLPSYHNSLARTSCWPKTRLCSWVNLRFPNSSFLPSTIASIPKPGMALNSVAGESSSPFTAAALTIASASECSEFFSAEAARRRISASVKPAAGMISVTAGFPRVKVPVLSSSTALILWAFSSVSALRMRIPYSAPLPVPTMIAVGVAKPKAHGQAITSTATKLRKA